MVIRSIFDANNWAAVPFHFWTLIFFAFGAVAGSFLNVCIYRLPLGQSVISPPSHCPRCKCSIPWYLNIPLVTWLYLGGRCRNCDAPIPARYFLVELFTAILFAGAWLRVGAASPALALVYCLVLSGLIVATFIDFEHFIIPDEITLGGMAAGFLSSALVPALHGVESIAVSMKQSLLGLWVGAGVVYLILRAGKLFFGRQRLQLTGETTIAFGESGMELPGRTVAFDEVFYRKSDTIVLRARRLELVDRCYREVTVRLSPKVLRIGEERIDPETVPWMEAICSEVVLPREAMGLGDVKFMGAIGAFLGWQAVLFALVVSSLVGALIGISLVAARRRELSSRLPYGPYLALGTALYIFAGPALIAWYQRLLFGSS